MKFFVIPVGVMLIGIACHDLFHTLFHPAGRGALSDRVGRTIWFICRKLSTPQRDCITHAGPVAILAIMMMWVLCMVFGFSFLYYPFIGTQFALAPGLDPARHRGYLDALNVSL